MIIVIILNVVAPRINLKSNPRLHPQWSTKQITVNIYKRNNIK
jgi:hypothetical protein